jgi:hypothetical protein
MRVEDLPPSIRGRYPDLTGPALAKGGDAPFQLSGRRTEPRL